MADDVIEYLPKSRLVKANFQFALPATATREQIEEWICHSLGYGSLGRDNPLFSEVLEIHGEPDLTDTGLHLHVSVSKSERGHRIHYLRRQEPYDGPSAIEMAMADSGVSDESPSPEGAVIPK